MYTLSLDKIFLNTRLYEEIKVHDLSVNTLLNLLFYYYSDDIFFFNPSLHCYCKSCDQKVFFSSIANKEHKESFYEYKFLMLENDYKDESEKINVLLSILQKLNYISKSFKCPNVSDGSHNISFIFKVIEGSLYKIGQYPSLDDMNRFKQNKVKEITREIFTELNQAHDLFASGSVNKAYIILREILDKRIITPKFLSKNFSGLKNKEVSISEKISFLKSDLPEILIHDEGLIHFLKKRAEDVKINESKHYFEIIYYAILIIVENDLSQ